MFATLAPAQPGAWPLPADPAQFLPVLLVGLASVLLGGYLLLALIRHSGAAALDPASALSLALSGGALLVILIAFPVLWLAHLLRAAPDLPAVFLLLAAALGLGTVLLLLRRPPRATPSARAALVLALLAAGLGVVRMWFLRGLLLPPYSDSIQHYLIVWDLLHPAATPGAYYTLDMTARYYHFGFHVFAAWVGALSGVSPAVLLPVLGQLLQVLIPLALYFPVRAATGSGRAALFGVLLAGIGWRMPGFASNWGKYPALAGLAVFPSALGLAWLAGTPDPGRAGRRWLWALALGATLLAALVHTRTLILIALALAGWWLAGRVLAGGWRTRLLAGLVYAALVGWVVFRAGHDPGLRGMFLPYTRDGQAATLLVLALAPLGLRSAPRATLTGCFCLLLILLAALVPMPAAMARLGYDTLLDRPFGQMALFMPLALMGGAGLAGLSAGLEPRRTINRLLWIGLAGALCLLPILDAVRVHDFGPSGCCQLVTADDLSAFDWMQAHLPPGAVVLVGIEKMPTQSYAVDGGAWLGPLTGIETRKFAHNLLVDGPEALAQVCATGARYVYAGSSPTRFPVELMAERPRWYRSLFTLPGAYVFQVVGCAAGD